MRSKTNTKTHTLKGLANCLIEYLNYLLVYNVIYNVINLCVYGENEKSKKESHIHIDTISIII